MYPAGAARAGPPGRLSYPRSYLPVSRKPYLTLAGTRPQLPLLICHTLALLLITEIRRGSLPFTFYEAAGEEDRSEHLPVAQVSPDGAAKSWQVSSVEMNTFNHITPDIPGEMDRCSSCRSVSQSFLFPSNKNMHTSDEWWWY